MPGKTTFFLSKKSCQGNLGALPCLNENSQNNYILSVEKTLN